VNSNNHHDPLDLLTIPELVELSKRSRRSVYYDIKNGRLHAVKIGRSLRVPRVEAERYVYGDALPVEP
jgi:predicted DNA-binding transcriptional regulator AlpA